MKKSLTFLLLIPAISLPSFIHADELKLKNGSVLIGKVLNKDGESLQFETPFAGVIKVKWENITYLHSDDAMQIQLKDKSIRSTHAISNTINKQNQELILENGQDRETIKQSELAYINPAPWQSGLAYQISGGLNVALKYQDGNTDKHEFELDGSLSLRKLADRFKFNGEFENAENLGEKTAESWMLSAQYDHFFSEKTFYGVNFQLEHDEFADLDLRQTYGIHIGHQYFESSSKHLSVRAGVSQTFEDFKSADSEDYLAIAWGVDYAQYIVPDRVEFYHRQEGQLSVEDTDKYIIKSWTGFRFPLASGFSISTEAQIDYDSKVSAGVDKTDTTYLVKLGYAF